MLPPHWAHDQRKVGSSSKLRGASHNQCGITEKCFNYPGRGKSYFSSELGRLHPEFVVRSLFTSCTFCAGEEKATANLNIVKITMKRAHCLFRCDFSTRGKKLCVANENFHHLPGNTCLNFFFSGNMPGVFHLFFRQKWNCPHLRKTFFLNVTLHHCASKALECQRMRPTWSGAHRTPDASEQHPLSIRAYLHLQMNLSGVRFFVFSFLPRTFLQLA